MKRKIQHDAVNNQEDEDSSTNRICFLSDATFDKKENKSLEDGNIHFLKDLSSNKDEWQAMENIPETYQSTLLGNANRY